MTHLIEKFRTSLLQLIGLSILFIPLCSIAQKHDHEKDSDDTYHGMIMSKGFFAEMKGLRATSDDSDASIYGSWNSVIPKIEGAAVKRILGMQTVHSVLLPSGKVLLTSGSSWRNYKNIETYPQYEDPAPAMGLFNLYDDPFRNTHTFPIIDTVNQVRVMRASTNFRKKFYYNFVNNTAIYNPVDSSFYRIPHPVPQDDPEDKGRFIPSDLFCSGHLQLADGNPLFIGGTQYYFPYRTGTKSTYIFDWKKELGIDWQSYDWRVMPSLDTVHYYSLETKTRSKTVEDAAYYPWVFSGFMERGRWYPSLVPLPDGRLVAFSGFVGFDNGFPTMFRFQINDFIEFFDPYQFSFKNPQNAWKAVNIKTKTNSPFTVPLNYSFVPTACTDSEFHSYWEAHSCNNRFPLPCDCDAACYESNQYDAFKLYPNNYLVDKNKIYLTREGDWVSLRTADAAYMRKTRTTYFMNIDGTVDNPDVSFEIGPNRPEDVTSYGTSYVDPNTNKITILAGQPTSAGTLLPIDAKKPTQFAGGRGSRKREQFWFDEEKWTLEKDFLGTEIEDDRTMLTAIILPTRQVLIINGGNYDFYGPVLFPILLTPRYDENGNFVDYERRRMSAAVEPRLYHNSALLLPDGRVWVSGGNSARASVSSKPVPVEDQNRNGQPKPDLNQVDLNMYFYRDGQMAKAEYGMQYTPTENWTAEIFSPPYLFIDTARTIRISNMERISKKANTTFKSTIKNKDFYLLQSETSYKLELTGLPEEQGQKPAAVVLIKLPSFTHNWDSGQLFLEMDITEENKGSISFTTPRFYDEDIPPGFYMLYYVDTKGKPSISQMVRLDDKATSALDSFLD